MLKHFLWIVEYFFGQIWCHWNGNIYETKIMNYFYSYQHIFAEIQKEIFSLIHSIYL